MPKLAKYIFVTLLAATAITYWVIWSELRQRPALSLHFLNVGQGDAELIRTRAGNVLIDAGKSGRVVYELDKFLQYPDRTIDIAMLTHPNLDHLAGFLEVLGRYNVRLFVMTGVRYDTLAEYQKLKKTIEAKRIPILYAVAGEEIKLGGPEIKIVWPNEFLRDKYFPKNDLNDTSVVARLAWRDFSALFTGDITANVERRLEQVAGRLTVLKVAHHGSKFASDAGFLGAVRPKYAVIEVGKNNYGHPTQEALGRLAAAGAKIFRTDLDGSVSFSFADGMVKINARQ